MLTEGNLEFELLIRQFITFTELLLHVIDEILTSMEFELESGHKY